MIVSCYPRSGSSWFVRVLADALGLYLTNKDESYINEGYSSRYEKAKALSEKRKVAFIDKSHYESFEKTRLINMNLDNKFVFLYRDPRDAILSYFYFVFYRQKKVSRKIALEYLKRFQLKKYMTLVSGQFDKVTFEDFFYTFVIHEIKRWKNYYAEWTGRENVLTLRYESIVNNTKKNVKQVAAFLNIDHNEDDIRKSIEQWSLENTKKAFKDTSLKKEERMVRTAKFGEWKDKFNQKTIDLFDSEFKSLEDVLYEDQK